MGETTTRPRTRRTRQDGTVGAIAANGGSGTDAPRAAGACHLRVGVTGHRTLPDDPRLARRVAEVVARIRELAGPSPDAAVRLTVLSALAEGADRMVAEAILRAPHGDLHAVLPLARADYATDFASVASRVAFDALMDAAARVSILPPFATREAAYEAAGNRVIEEADALIALWDGLPARGQGGTAHVVAFARERGLPLFWLSTAAPYPLWEELGRGLRRCDGGTVRTKGRAAKGA